MSSLPAGAVTFLFSDIEGSTKLWQQQPAAMKTALARHDIILRTTIESHGGYVFKTMGDEFCAAFPTAPEALAAALSIQRALQAEDWVAGGTPPLRVRMALHTGAAEVRDGDYFGASLSRVERLMAAGHGGQVLLSHPAYDLVRDDLPQGASLRDMGERRLVDLPRALREMRRVIKPGSRVVCLEITHTTAPLFRQLFHLYFYGIVPLIGGLVTGNFPAYAYLPQSLAKFPPAPALRRLMEGAGFCQVWYRLLGLGTVAIHVGVV